MPTAVILTQGVSPYGRATVRGLPGSSKRTVVVPFSVDTCSLRTCAPTAVALGVTVSVALVIGRTKSTCSHCPIAGCSESDTQAVAESRSRRGKPMLSGATSGSAVESDDELEALSRPPDRRAPDWAPGAGREPG